jgi:hypothetical protein
MSDAADRDKRDGRILELWQMGWHRKAIAEVTGLTPQRVSQIVLSFGVRERRR